MMLSLHLLAFFHSFLRFPHPPDALRLFLSSSRWLFSTSTGGESVTHNSTRGRWTESKKKSISSSLVRLFFLPFLSPASDKHPSRSSRQEIEKWSRWYSIENWMIEFVVFCIYMCSIPLGRWSAGFSTWIFTRCLNINFIFFIVFFLRCFSNLRFLAYSCRLALASESNDMWLIRRQRCVGQVTEKWELARSLLNYINSNLYYSTFYYQTRLVSSLMDFTFCSHSFRSDFF